MPGANKPSVSKTADAFTRAIERALEHYNDLDWLGAESPLATPYFLGERTGPAADEKRLGGRGEKHVLGRALRQVLADAAQQLPGEQQRLVEAAFLRRD